MTVAAAPTCIAVAEIASITKLNESPPVTNTDQTMLSKDEAKGGEVPSEATKTVVEEPNTEEAKAEEVENKEAKAQEYKIQGETSKQINTALATDTTLAAAEGANEEFSNKRKQEEVEFESRTERRMDDDRTKSPAMTVCFQPKKKLRMNIGCLQPNKAD
jgi:hypothetical protein